MTSINVDTSEKFASGTSRIVYLGTVSTATNSDPFKAGDEVVVKVMKSEFYNRGIRLTDLDFRTQRRAESLAIEFTNHKLVSNGGEPLAVLFQGTKLWRFDRDHYNSEGRKVIVAGEYGLVEKKINGYYEKFNSNNGFTEGEERADFFSNWTYCYTGGHELVCDLQGTKSYGSNTLIWRSARYRHYLFLTDPVILSTE